MGRTRQVRWVISGLVLAVLIAVVCLYCGYGAGWAAWLVSRGKEQISVGSYDEGIDSLRRAHEIDPGQPEGALLLARHHAARGDAATARTILEELDRTGQHSYEVLDLLGRLHEAAGETERARDCHRRFSERFPASIAGPLGLARTGNPEPLAAVLVPLPALDAVPPWRGLALFHLEDAIGGRGYGTAACAESLLAARRLGANAVSMRVPGRQQTVRTPTITYGHEQPGGETDAVLRQTIRDARLLGLRVLLKPHIMLDQITLEEWRGVIDFEPGADLDAWWRSYREFVVYYARMAADEQVDAFCVGVELRALVKRSPERWSQLIADVRAVFPGKLIYAANWYHEYEEVPFWAELDAIGVQFFFPLGKQASPSLEALCEQLAPIAGRLDELSFGFGRPVLFTEVGFKSAVGATIEPWQWPAPEHEVDMGLQARAYRAILITFEGHPSFVGQFWWNWLTDPRPGSKFRTQFTPQGKPAEKVLEEYWRQ